MPDFAKLEPEAVKKVMDAEKDLGALLIAYERPPEFTILSGEDLDKIQKLEKEMGIKLVAYN
jgi:hypothetical protein